MQFKEAFSSNNTVKFNLVYCVCILNLLVFHFDTSFEKLFAIKTVAGRNILAEDNLKLTPCSFPVLKPDKKIVIQGFIKKNFVFISQFHEN
jgi:hypothetical protein